LPTREPNNPSELRSEPLRRHISVYVEIIGGVLGNSHRPFGPVHGVLSVAMLLFLEVHQRAAKPERFGRGRQALNTLKAVQNRSIRSMTFRRAVAKAVGFKVIAAQRVIRTRESTRVSASSPSKLERELSLPSSAIRSAICSTSGARGATSGVSRRSRLRGYEGALPALAFDVAAALLASQINPGPICPCRSRSPANWPTRSHRMAY
jgi:hypothetical protein